jgi:hemerythrin superfamily protein
MSDTKLRIPKATSLLKEDHQAVKKLFRQYKSLKESQESEKQSIVDQIRELLQVHSKIEEEIFYPAVARLDDSKAGVQVREAEEEHRLVKTLLDDLSALAPGGETFEAKMILLMESVLHHAEMEESDLFQLFGRLERAERDRVSEQLLSRKRELSGEA